MNERAGSTRLELGTDENVASTGELIEREGASLPQADGVSRETGRDVQPNPHRADWLGRQDSNLRMAAPKAAA
ncbi:MAG: hypothetical protein V4574_00110, partial [Pseudomonadota bacterium]